jgi:hypothetical protein
MRQSAGNKVAKRLSASSPARETIEGPVATLLTCVARVRSPLLLKTASRRLEVAFGLLPDGPFQYSGATNVTQCAAVASLRPTFPLEVPFAQQITWPPTSFRHRNPTASDEAATARVAAGKSGNSSPHISRAALKTLKAHTSQTHFVAGKRALRYFRSGGIEIR